MKKLRIKKWVKSTLAVMLAVFLILTSVMYSFGAQMFTDVTDKHWSKKYVESMSSKKIVTGYEDATFKPDKSVSRIESIVLITRLFDPKEVQATYDANKSKYEKALKDYGILTYADWAKEEIVFALEKNIINNEKLLSSFVKNGNPQNALRWEIAVYLARGLDLEKELNKVVVLGFKDANQIPSEAKPYVDVLIKKGIINSSGDYKGNFNPKNPVTRAEMSKMLYVAYDLKNKNGNTNTNTDTNKNTDTNTNTDNSQILTSVEGKIDDVLEYNGNITLTIKDSRDKKLVFSNKKSDISIKFGSQTAKIEDLKEGREVKLTISGSKLYSVKLSDVEEEKEGYFYTVSFDANGNHTIKFKIGNNYEEYKVKSTTKIKLDGENASAYNLDKEDKVTIKIKNGDIEEIDAISKNFEVDGIIQEVSSSKIEIETDDKHKKTYKFDIDKDVKVKRNNDRAKVSDLRVGDKVDLEVEYDKVVDIDADTVKTKVKGILKEIKMAQTPEITILDNDNKTKTYKLAPGFEVEVDDRSAGLYDLRINHKIEITLESGEVTEIEADDNVSMSTYTGKIKDIDTGDNEIELENNTDGKTIYIRYSTSRVKFIDIDGHSLSESNFDDDDIISVVGEDKLGSVEAKIITRIENH
ncbi:S-layer homology domain-containing protein [Tepidibacter hydrothermalis]|uniref:S-layer homology domain-containing protein n=1 Tax=Tepidibacter hydrothermalis TaxID=3036126 RepID=A0ABY8ECQ5_9FIRM|nr:S-layer homology domain-containing protein [Tepidibacter hydrothermalis]WFD10561.1 S-layer homology domain-containing protein [Tepidibacter hydrothermalis]